MSIPIPHPPEPGNASEFHKIVAASYDDAELDKVKLVEKFYVSKRNNTETKEIEAANQKPYDQETDPANICARSVGAYIRLKEFGASDERACEQASEQLELLGFEVVYTIIDEDGDDE